MSFIHNLIHEIIGDSNRSFQEQVQMEQIQQQQRMIDEHNRQFQEQQLRDMDQFQQQQLYDMDTMNHFQNDVFPMSGGFDFTNCGCDGFGGGGFGF